MTHFLTSSERYVTVSTDQSVIAGNKEQQQRTGARRSRPPTVFRIFAQALNPVPTFSDGAQCR
jgi:hypothetical protein